jgi:hypothetical protein
VFSLRSCDKPKIVIFSSSVYRVMFSSRSHSSPAARKEGRPITSVAFERRYFLSAFIAGLEIICGILSLGNDFKLE